MQLNTFSIAARCARTGMLGVAVSTAVPAVGAICPACRPGVGAVSTQAWVNPYLAVAHPRADLRRGGDAAAGAPRHPRQTIPPRRPPDRRGGCRGPRRPAGPAPDCTPWFGHAPATATPSRATC